MSDAVGALSSDAAAGIPGRTGGASAQASGARTASAKGTGSGDTLTLSPEAKALVAKLQARDAEVKAHEQAHLSAGGSLVTSGASYSYEKGPDGLSYAVGGEVSIDTSPVRGNPSATVAKAERIEAAALAPADPSGQDAAVASEAAVMAAQASQEAQGSQTSQGSQSSQASHASQASQASQTYPTSPASRGTPGGLFEAKA